MLALRHLPFSADPHVCAMPGLTNKGLCVQVELLQQLRHRNIVQFYGACLEPDCFFIVTELLAGVRPANPALACITKSCILCPAAGMTKVLANPGDAAAGSSHARTACGSKRKAAAARKTSQMSRGDSTCMAFFKPQCCAGGDKYTAHTPTAGLGRLEDQHRT